MSHQKKEKNLEAYFSENEYNPSKDAFAKFSNPSPVSSDETKYSIQFWRMCILMITIFWATNFPIIKLLYASVPGMSASLYYALRFPLASMMFIPAIMAKKHNSKLIFKSVVCGIVISLSYIGQGIGIRTSTADKAAFACCMQIVWVAILVSIISWKLKLQTWVSVILAIIGTAMMEIYGSTAPVVGDAWLMLQPIGFGTGYVLLEDVVRNFPEDTAAITGFKLLGVSFCMIIWALVEGNTLVDTTPVFQSNVAVIILLYTAFVTTGGAIWAQSVCFRKVSAADASIIIATEPIWAAVVGFMSLGEELGVNDIIGAFFIMFAGVSYELKLVDQCLARLNNQKS